MRCLRGTVANATITNGTDQARADRNDDRRDSGAVKEAMATKAATAIKAVMETKTVMEAREATEAKAVAASAVEQLVLQTFCSGLPWVYFKV